MTRLHGGVRPSDPKATFAEPDDGATAEVPAAERFRVQEELARGGLGRVLRGYDTHLAREVAIKTLLRTSASARARFERETRLTARLQHPNIVPVYDGGVDPEGLPFFAMRLVRGRTLTAEIERAPTLEDRLRLLPQVIAVCNAVAYAHHERITHRDLKPDNILVGDFGETLVIDWGLAKDLDALEEPTDPGEQTSGSSGSLTRVGSVVGTPAYMPPEQAAGRPVDVRADVYALGAVLYHVLAGRAPYDGAADVVVAVVTGPPAPVVTLAPGAPRDLVAVVDKAMARDPAGRYPDAQALAAELERFQAGRFVGAHHYTLRERGVRLVRQNPVTTLLAACLVLGGVTGVVALSWANRIAEQRRADAEVARAQAEALQRAERERLDVSTLEQARLLVEHDPARSLVLLSTLSPEVRFGGGPRTVAAAALAAEPPRPLPGPPHGIPVKVTWAGDLPLVAWDGELRTYPPAGPRTIASAPMIKDVEVEGDRVGFCTTTTLSTVNLATGARTDAPIPAICLGVRWSEGALVALTIDGQHVALDADGRGRPLPGLPASINVGEPIPGGGWLASEPPRGAVALLDGSGVQEAETGPATYGLVPSPTAPLALRLGADPPMHQLRWDGGRLRAEVVPVDADWLEHGAFLGPTTAIVGGGEEALFRVDLTTHEVRRIGLPSRLRTLRGLADGRVLIGGESGDVAILDPATGDRVVLAGSDEPIVSLEPSPDGRSVLTMTPHAVARQALGSVSGGLVHRHGARVERIGVSEDGTVLVAGRAGVDEVRPDGSVVRRAAIPTYSLARCGGSWWEGHFDGSVGPLGAPAVYQLPERAFDVACAPDDATIAFASGGAVVVLDAVTGAVLEERRRDDLAATAFAADGTLLVAGRAVETLDSLAGAGPSLARTGTAMQLVTSPAGAWVGTLDGAVWEVAPTPRPLGMQSGVVTAMAPVGSGVLVGDEQGGVTLWRGPDAPPEALVGHRQYVSSIAVRPGDRFVATGGWDETVWLWDLDTVPATGRPLRGHADAVIALTWSTDGATLYSGDRSGVVRAWTDPLPLDPDALRAEVERRAALIDPR